MNKKETRFTKRFVNLLLIQQDRKKEDIKDLVGFFEVLIKIDRRLRKEKKLKQDSKLFSV